MKNVKLNLKNSALLFIFIFMAVQSHAQKQFSLQSPDKKIEVQIRIGNIIEYSIQHDKDIMLAWSPISLTLTDGTFYGVNSKLSGTSAQLVNETILSPVYKKNEVINHYNELLFRFNNEFNLIFRAYDDGVAYRFVSTSKKSFQIKDEQVELNFPEDNKAYVPYVQHKRNSLEEQFYNSFENTYEHINLSQWDKERLAFLPIVIEGAKGKKIAVSEADLLNYPGMYLYNGSAKASLKGVFAPYPKETKQGGHNMLQDEVESREDYIAKFDKGGEFPWRAFIISEHDYQLANNDMVYKLASSAPKDLDFGWVKPGKVAWDWWNDWNVYGVDFKTGINNPTYKYYIDFASQHGIEYVILDEGWAVNLQADLMQVVPEINLAELVAYADERNVGLILWAGYYALNRDIEGLCKHYSEMGIKGFKVDFMDRDDQPMVAFHTRSAGIAARYKMLIDYHGSYKPTGLHKTYPNVINFEGVYGLEQMKWASTDVDQVTYDVTMPYIRMLAGPIDYTQGAMRNAVRENYRPVNSEAMSQGTRCRQLAQYVIFESPLNMLCDSPSNYMKEAECTAFISEIPTVWDQTIALDGEIGKYISIARKKNDIWYVGAMTNWDARTIELDLSFLGDGNYQVEIYKDGVNADKAARDYVKEVIAIGGNKKLMLNMSPGGGFAMKITKQ
ncbi:Retaining alpha-galactosidase [uncultured Dysgonomonas sp.]|uniref:Retaining alpha-galactosidase n=2 Tax=uncultured Dysgonomonas sp. TaxID=206096 RepID=A0A212K5S3_9BACT|nr:Retaining alpha-galactosidase [uncultured Dysgonomonas sp.]